MYGPQLVYPFYGWCISNYYWFMSNINKDSIKICIQAFLGAHAFLSLGFADTIRPLQEARSKWCCWYFLSCLCQWQNNVLLLSQFSKRHCIGLLLLFLPQMFERIHQRSYLGWDFSLWNIFNKESNYFLIGVGLCIISISSSQFWLFFPPKVSYVSCQTLNVFGIKLFTIVLSILLVTVESVIMSPLSFLTWIIWSSPLFFLMSVDSSYQFY